MTGITIDHMVSLVALIAVLTASMSAYGQIMSGAVIYQRNHQVSMKAAELANSLLLSPGYPIDWFQRNNGPLAFGLQDAETGGYSLNSFSLSRLLSMQPLVYYNKTDLWYGNNSLGGLCSLLVPLIKAVNYTTAARLLSIEGSYAFHLTVKPTLKVTLSELSLNPLRIEVDVKGFKGSVGEVSLSYFLCVAVPGVGQYPSFQTLSGFNRTDSSGSATLEFSSIDCSTFAYSIVAYACVGGLSGVGCRCRDSIVNNKIIPFVEDFANRAVLLAHSWDLRNFPPPVTALSFNTTFVALAQDFQPREIQMVSSGEFVRTGLVNYSTGYEYVRTQIPTQSAGILFVAYRWENSYGIATMPWGISSLGFSVEFGGNPSSADWVAVELRQVAINRVSYQAELAVWRTSGYQQERYSP